MKKVLMTGGMIAVIATVVFSIIAVFKKIRNEHN